MKKKLLCSFSGGESSAYMAEMLKLNVSDRFDILNVFANTGEEREETLEFVDRCDKEFGLNVVWVEAVINSGRNGTTHKVVSFDTASRKGEPFERMIEKYGIPNKSYPHCTRELKLAPIYSYMKSIGFDYDAVAIGIRADEPKRWRKDAEEAKIVYPLSHWFPIDKPGINDWWKEQSFRLNLRPHEGNCSWCWKKSQNKHFRLIDERPEVFDFPRRMELIHGETNSKHGKRVFFRENRSTDNLFAWREAIGGWNFEELDEDADAGCTESCDIHGEIS